MPDLVECQRCHEPVLAEQLLEHLRLLHPDVDAEPGDTVAVDLTQAAARAAEIRQRAKPIDTCPECGKPIEPTRQALIDELATHGYRMYERDGQGWVVEREDGP